ncbi:hypothetical protein RB195_001499 [Necator americanus]|uniref:Uncharacterized protein n=2 Tax=Necator americanus TaxID=51031 RepID=A0ABR1DFS5_NECAM|nr:hypothetical protein NECAME_06225 [Necator americanus]ETN85805.1 hypothetical protein NECAME_06225 [Necator americanus]
MSTATSQILTNGGYSRGHRISRKPSRSAIQSTVELAHLAHKQIFTTQMTSNIAVVLFAMFYVVMGVIGFLNFDNCPVRDEIPVWMIVASLTSLVNIASHFYKVYKESREQSYPLYVRVIDGIILVFRPVWFIAGCVWVYTAYEYVTFDTSGKESYCDQLTYSTALVFSTIFFVIILFILACLCCACCYVIFHEPDADDHP